MKPRHCGSPQSDFASGKSSTSQWVNPIRSDDRNNGRTRPSIFAWRLCRRSQVLIHRFPADAELARNVGLSLAVGHAEALPWPPPPAAAARLADNDTAKAAVARTFTQCSRPGSPTKTDMPKIEPSGTRVQADRGARPTFHENGPTLNENNPTTSAGTHISQ